MDPRRAGAAARADQWLRVRPGTDGALALGLAAVMIAEGWYDRDFIRDWSNGAFLVRADNGRLLTAADLSAVGSHATTSRGIARRAGRSRTIRPPPTSSSRSAIRSSTGPCDA